MIKIKNINLLFAILLLLTCTCNKHNPPEVSPITWYPVVPKEWAIIYDSLLNCTQIKDAPLFNSITFTVALGQFKCNNTLAIGCYDYIKNKITYSNNIFQNPDLTYTIRHELLHAAAQQGHEGAVFQKCDRPDNEDLK